MDLLKSDIKKTYLRYLITSFGSAIITSIYGLVDMAMIGQYYGPKGSSAMAVVAPVWNLIYSLGLLVGIGGSIVYSHIKGSICDTKKQNSTFTISIIYGLVLGVLALILMWTLEEPLLYLFGATDDLLPLAKEYLTTVKYCVPVFIFTQILSSFLRNDSDPLLATISVVIGGVFNIFGDWFLIFFLDLGAVGAGAATSIGAIVSVLIMLTHFLKKSNNLKLTKPVDVLKNIKLITSSGFASFFVDVSMGILTLVFNQQIGKYLNDNCLAVYGIAINISTFVQCCAYGIGQATQPILSQNYAAKKYDRIKKLFKYNLITVFVLSVIWTTLAMAIPNGFVKIFMKPTPEVLKIAPSIIRIYSIAFLFIPLNVYSTYFFQSVLKPKTSFVVSIARGLVVSCALLYILPLIEANTIWFSIPLTEVIVSIYVTIMFIKTFKAIKVTK